MKDILLDSEGVRAALNLESIQMVEALRKKRKIPFVRLGYRTIRYRYDAVMAAMATMETRAL